MIKNTSIIEPAPDIKGILCIDCWEDENLQYFYKNLENKICFSEIDSICVASYELLLDSNDLSQKNLLELYSWSCFDPSMLLPVMKESRFRTTSKWLQSKFSSHSILLLDMYSLEKHIKTSVPHIENWLVIGGGYRGCIHSRPVSLPTIRKLPYNFFITTWSVYNIGQGRISELDIDNDTLEYARCQDGFFKIL